MWDVDGRLNALVRPERAGDEAPLRAVHAAAFGGPAEGRIVDAIRDTTDAVAGLSLVAELDGDVVGHCLCSRGWLDGRRPILVLGPIGVLPRCQGRGIGSDLMVASIEAADAAGEVLIALVGHPTYYPRFGFVAARGLGLEPPLASWSDAAWQARPLRAWDPSDPDARGTVSFPGAFDPL